MMTDKHNFAFIEEWTLKGGGWNGMLDCVLLCFISLYIANY